MTDYSSSNNVTQQESKRIYEKTRVVIECYCGKILYEFDVIDVKTHIVMLAPCEHCSTPKVKK